MQLLLLSYLLTYLLAAASGLIKTNRRHGIGLELLDFLFQQLDSRLIWVWVVITVAVQLLVSFVVKVAVAVPEYSWMLLTVLVLVEWSSAMKATSAVVEVALEHL